jgi:hypothetical protein
VTSGAIGLTVTCPGSDSHVLNSTADWMSMNGDVNNCRVV